MSRQASLPALAAILLSGVSCGQSRDAPDTSPAPPSSRSVSRQTFGAAGLQWPLTVDEATIGCTGNARWVRVGGTSYGLNGFANVGRGYRPLESIWAVDERTAAEYARAGIPNDPPVRINVGDMIQEAGKLC